MNYNISQILNFENCNAGVPITLIRAAAVETIRDNWAHDLDLAEAFQSGNLNIPAETESVNESLANAGCRTRVTLPEIGTALSHWVEAETLRGNM
jgi:hypothetical protein